MAATAEVHAWLWKRQMDPQCSQPTPQLDFPRPIVHSLYSQPYFVSRMQRAYTLEGHTGCVNSLYWSERGDTLLTGSDDKTLRIWNPFDPQKKERVIPTGHTSNIFSAKYLPNTNDQVIVSAAGDAEVRVFDLSRDVSLLEHVYTCHSHPVKTVATIGSSPFEFLTCSEDSTVRHFDLRQPHTCGSHFVHSFNSTRRRLSTQYPSQHAHVSPRPLQAGCPKPLLDFSLFGLDLNGMTLNQWRPYYFAVAGMDDYLYLLDRRMMPQTHSSFARRHSIPSCVARFQPDRTASDGAQQHHERHQSRYITSCKFSDANGDELLGNWAGDAVYLFNILHGINDNEPTTRVLSPSMLASTRAPREYPPGDVLDTDAVPAASACENATEYTNGWVSAFREDQSLAARRKYILDALESKRFIRALRALNDYYLHLQHDLPYNIDRHHQQLLTGDDDNDTMDIDDDENDENGEYGENDENDETKKKDATGTASARERLQEHQHDAHLHHAWVHAMLALTLYGRVKETARWLRRRCNMKAIENRWDFRPRLQWRSKDGTPFTPKLFRDDLLSIKVEMTKAVELAPKSTQGAWLIMVTYFLMCGIDGGIQKHWYNYNAHGYEQERYDRYNENPFLPEDTRLSNSVPNLSHAKTFCHQMQKYWQYSRSNSSSRFSLPRKLLLQLDLLGRRLLYEADQPKWTKWREFKRVHDKMLLKSEFQSAIFPADAVTYLEESRRQSRRYRSRNSSDSDDYKEVEDKRRKKKKRKRAFDAFDAYDEEREAVNEGRRQYPSGCFHIAPSDSDGYFEQGEELGIILSEDGEAEDREYGYKTDTSTAESAAEASMPSSNSNSGSDHDTFMDDGDDALQQDHDLGTSTSKRRAAMSSDDDSDDDDNSEDDDDEDDDDDDDDDLEDRLMAAFRSYEADASDDAESDTPPRRARGLSFWSLLNGGESDHYGDDDDDDDDNDNDNDAMDADSDEDDSIYEHGYQQLNSRQRAIRTVFDLKIPVRRPQQAYVGHVNIRTIKDVNFFGANDEYVVSGSDDGRGYIWDKQSGRLLQILEGDTDTVNNIVGHPTLPLIAMSGIDDSVKIFAPIADRTNGGSCMAESDDIVRENRRFNSNARGTSIYSTSSFNWISSLLRENGIISLFEGDSSGDEPDA